VQLLAELHGRVAPTPHVWSGRAATLLGALVPAASLMPLTSSVASTHQGSPAPQRRTRMTAMRRNLLQWVGVLGLAINLLGSLDPIFQLAEWARYLVRHWEYWTREILVPFFAIFRIHLSGIGALTVSMDIFIILVFISSIDFRTDLGTAVEQERPATTARFQKIAAWAFIIFFFFAEYIVVFIKKLHDSGVDLNSTEPLPPSFFNFSVGEVIVVDVCLAIKALLTFMANPLKVARRFLNSLVLLAVILGLNYISIHSEQIRALLSPPKS
jgi:hypothetical protein